MQQTYDNMKNVSSSNSSNTESPKTPGGISKSLLTPCRRVGLSRNWKKGGPSPFISPLSSGEVKQEKVESRKRKERVLVEACETTRDIVNNSQNDIISVCSVSKDVDIVKTPSRNVDIGRRKRSKTLLSTINKTKSNAIEKDDSGKEKICENIPRLNDTISFVIGDIKTNNEIEAVSTPVRLKSKSKNKKCTSSFKSSTKDVVACKDSYTEIKDDLNAKPIEVELAEEIIHKKSPNDLTKECIVVIQKKIFKKHIKDSVISQNKDLNVTVQINKSKQDSSVSQTLFDSDTDDVPLSRLNKNETEIISTIQAIYDDDDFTTTKTKIRKIEEINTQNSKTNSKKPINTKLKLTKNTLPIPEVIMSHTDDDDFDFDSKKTIIIRKTYEKVSQPLKAKSTGSITQKDIDDLKARIESKKQRLLAKAMTEDTKELRDLIKKWQKGCQDALMELMDLMKTKFPDKSNMDYSEILQTLKIPASLVGYDAENDSFNTPDDARIVLANVNDL